LSCAAPEQVASFARSRRNLVQNLLPIRARQSYTSNKPFFPSSDFASRVLRSILVHQFLSIPAQREHARNIGHASGPAATARRCRFVAAFLCTVHPLLRRWLRRYGVGQPDTDELVQEVLAVVARDLPKFRHNERRGAFRCWLRTILVHRLRNCRRSERQQPVAHGSTLLLDRLADQLEDPRSNLSRLFDIEHDLYITHRALDAIQPEFKPHTWRAFRRLMLENAEPETVAAELGMSVPAVYTAKSRILNRLRQEMRGLV
jgi:RNA polymerase sigma-70 factor (ECF subfamily)